MAATDGHRRVEPLRLARKCLGTMGEALNETLWPTRCAVCNRPGSVLCSECERNLPYLDHWQACPVCGAPWGIHECTECNRLSLQGTGYDTVPLDGCVSAVLFGDDAASLVRLNKDAGERRLADVMARLVANAVPPDWLPGSRVTYIPASESAKRRRGFDHGLELGEATARWLGVPCERLLARPRARDQRKLSRADRFANLSGAFAVEDASRVPPRVIVVDDVLTTGATLFDAACALKRAGAGQVYGATFARVY